MLTPVFSISIYALDSFSFLAYNFLKFAEIASAEKCKVLCAAAAHRCKGGKDAEISHVTKNAVLI